jgi:hypothetical protein
MTPSSIGRSVAAAWISALFSTFAASPGLVSAQETAAPDTSSATSATIDSLEAKMERSKWTRWLTDFVFVGRARSDSANAMPITEVPSEVQYRSYGGRFIRHIDIAQLPVFNTERAVPGKVLGLADALHIDTRKRIIRGYLLMKEGTPLDPYLLADSERILRGTSFIQDATIVVIPVEQTADSVDLLVVTQDVWSLGVAGSFRGVGMYKVGLFERNFLGLGQFLETEFDVSRNRSQELDFTALYRYENIGGSFVDLDARYVDSHIEDRSQIAFTRPFRTVKIRYGGALDLSRVETKDVSGAVTTSYDLRDLWVGRAFRMGGDEDWIQGRRELTVAGRIVTRDYIKRGPVSESTDRSLHNSTLILGGVSWSLSEYRKALLLTTYGNTDDIGTGYLVGLTGGYEDGEFNDRWYAGGRLSAGGFGDRIGYYAWLVEAGEFFSNGDSEDGAVRLNLSGFSKLSRPGRYRYRLLYGVDYLAGFDRQSSEVLKLRVPGIETEFADRQRLSLDLEGVAFTPWRTLGFRFTLFAALGLGTVGPDPDSFLRGKYYSSFGVGFRFHSDRLIFGAYEVRFVYVPTVPPEASTTALDFSNVRGVRGGDFTPGPPGGVRYE